MPTKITSGQAIFCTDTGSLHFDIEEVRYQVIAPIGNKELLTSSSSSMILQPNKYYRNINTSLSSLTITLAAPENNNIINEYLVEFTTAASGTTISLPSSIKWANGETPSFSPNTIYQISIVNNLGVYIKFA